MITPEYAQRMASYNRWMNEKIYAACAQLSDADRKADRGAFFKSIHATLSHLVWGDGTWLGRFTRDTPLAKEYPASTDAGIHLFEDWEALQAARIAMDVDITRWADAIEPSWLAADFSWYSGLKKAHLTKPTGLLVMHLFNHQTHHRGQVTTLMSQLGIDPGETDLMLMPD